MTDIRLPIGVQNFESLRRDGFTYIDKTEYIFNLVHGNGRAFFLSRPRRFGKSLFLSALRAYWEGKKELFQGLAIEKLERAREESLLSSNEKNSDSIVKPEIWESHPVFCFDFNKKNFREGEALEDVLDEHLRKWESIYEVAGGELTGDKKALDERFRIIIEKACHMTGKKVVILVDEYDKPLLENSGTKEHMDHDKAVFKGFFSTLKSYDEFIRFSFLTGVTKFSKVSIFSDLNHLKDISLNKDYSGICGITEAEIHEKLDVCVEGLADENDMTKDECYVELKKMYDGYHFHQDAVGVYNPFSLLYALSDREFGAWWFETGTPTFLVEKLSESRFDIRSITEGTVYASESMIKDYREDNPDPIPLLYQSGYLTIAGYERRKRRYTLGYPNEEVKYGMLESLAPVYLGNTKKANHSLNVFLIDDYIERGDVDSLRDTLVALYASLPYPTGEGVDRMVEQNFQNVAYLVFMLLGKFVHTEVHSAKGRSDVVVETEQYVYIMEFKRDSSAEEALCQIEEMGYAKPYAADSRTIIRIGANFDSESRTLNDWKTA